MDEDMSMDGGYAPLQPAFEHQPPQQVHNGNSDPGRKQLQVIFLLSSHSNTFVACLDH